MCGGQDKDLGCDGRCFSNKFKDCAGVCGGNAMLDECGVCNGNNKDKGCDGVCFSGLEEDCTGVCGGIVKVDSCGICGGSDKDKGCDGVCFSRKSKDCSGVCGGKAALDTCGVCGGNDKDLGCDGTCFSGKKTDCDGVCGGPKHPDDCGVCGGNNQDKDCAGVCFGKAFIDGRGKCVLGGASSTSFFGRSTKSTSSSSSSHSHSHSSSSSFSAGSSNTVSRTSSGSSRGSRGVASASYVGPDEEYDESLPVCGEEPAPPPTCGAPAPQPSCGAPAPQPSCGCAASTVTREEVGPSWVTQALLRILFITLLGSAVGTAVIRYLLGKRVVADDAITISYVKESMDPRAFNERMWGARRRAVRMLCVTTSSAAVLPNSDRPKAALAALVRLASPSSRGSVYLVFSCGGVEAAVAIMAVCRSNAAVLTNVCTLLHELASTPSTVTRMRHHLNVANGKIPLAVLTVMRLFPAEPRAVEAAAAALWSFAFASGAFIQSTLVRGDAHLDLMAAIVRYPTDIPVLYRACGALMALALRNPEAQKAMGEAGAAHLLMETLTAHRELNYGGDFSELRVWMRKYAAENPRPMLEGSAAAGGASAGSNWWDIVRDQGPLPDTAFRTITLPPQAAPGKSV